MARTKTTPLPAVPRKPVIVNKKVSLPGGRAVDPDIVDKINKFGRGVDKALGNKVKRRLLRQLDRSYRNNTRIPPTVDRESWQYRLFETFLSLSKPEQEVMISDMKNQYNEQPSFQNSTSRPVAVRNMREPIDKFSLASTGEPADLKAWKCKIDTILEESTDEDDTEDDEEHQGMISIDFCNIRLI